MAGKPSLIGRISNRIKSALGGYPLPITGGTIPADWPWNWWQQGRNPLFGSSNATVESCLDAYAQTTALMPAAVYRVNPRGERERLSNIAASRLMRHPNDYQTISDFKYNLVRELMRKGNAYAVGIRNDRYEFSSIHLLPSSTMPYVDPEEHQVFYAAGDNPLLGHIETLIPARDILHIRLHTPYHPLKGVSPIEYAVLSSSANASISAHQASFFNNMSRPSGVLSTELKLNRQQMLELRQAWEDQAKQLNSGGIPILANGIKWEQMGITSQVAQLVEAFNMTVTDIARAFRVPLPLVNLYENATYNNVEQLYAQWLSGGLGFVVEHVERALERFFSMPPDQIIHFDTEELLRTDFQARVEGYTKLVQGGVMTINEARVKVGGLHAVPHGDTPIVQQQMVPLGWEPPVAEPAAPVEPPSVEGPDDDDQKASVIYLRDRKLLLEARKNNG